MEKRKLSNKNKPNSQRWRMNCRIILNNPEAHYSPTELISGKVNVYLPSAGNIQSIICKIVGKEETKWIDNENVYDQRTKSVKSVTVQYKGEHICLSENLLIANDVSAVAGLHEFLFTLTLPKTVPSTYKSNYGSIQYRLYATARISGDTLEDDLSIFVKSSIDFNDIKRELQMEPVVYQNEEVIWHCCYAGDPVTMDLILEREAYLVDEPILFKLDVNNKSNEDISQIHVTLTLVIEATAIAPKLSRKYFEKILTGAKVAGLVGGKQELHTFRFEVPTSIEIPNFIGSTLFRQKCVLKAESKIQNSDTKLDVQTEIKLGHIPLERSRRVTHPHGPVRRVHSSGAINRPLGFNFFNATSDSAASAPAADHQPSAPSKTTDDIDYLPPSYDEAIKSKFD